jgi:LuxR family maltose regulon positive regulatory protein
MDQAKKLAQVTDANQWDDLIVSAYAACLFIREGNLPEALRSRLSHGSILPTRRLEHPDAPYMVIELLDITFIRLRIAEAVQDRERIHQLSVPFRVLQERMEDARKHDRGETLLELLILQAEIYQLTGEPDLAVCSIFEALRSAQDEGYLRVFCDEGELLLPRLREARDRITPADSISLSFLLQLIQLISGEAAANADPLPSSRAENLNGGEITRREEEILALIAAGYSNQEIANELFLSLNTVRRHVYHIFNKLDAQSRVQAVNIARQRGLLNPP